jgi:ABC-type Mn2+/Zn2+ transport system permease subunit
MTDLWRGLALNLPGLTAGLLIAVVCSYLGVYVVLKRIVFVGVSLSQISSAGIALAFLAGSWLPFAAHAPLAVSILVTLAGALLFSLQTVSPRVPRESVIGIGYLVASALTLMFIVRSPKGMDEVRELLDGSIITVQAADVMVLAIVTAIVLLTHALFYKQFLFISFDPEMAATQGYHVRAWEIAFYMLLGSTIAVSIHLAGVLAVFAYLVIPAVTSLVLARRMPGAFAIALACAVIGTVGGFVWALQADLPTSPPMIAVLAGLLAVAAVGRKPARAG